MASIGYIGGSYDKIKKHRKERKRDKEKKEEGKTGRPSCWPGIGSRLQRRLDKLPRDYEGYTAEVPANPEPTLAYL